MPLAPATRLGPYEIVAAVGAGGMGEVYRARDTRLDRIVAIKILPEHLSSKPELRERFEREARAVSNLNHPHICILHDVGHQDGIDFLVMEFIEGESLAARLAKGPLPVDHVLRHGIQIAGALDQAHRHGVVHRDLKPGNIMLTKSGVKLLDFGLAKVRGAEDGVLGGQLTSLATQTTPLTSQGTILGTFQYMAPEQLEGKEADARSDIFSFGAVLYEMITGRRAFDGKSHASLIAAILEHDPAPITALGGPRGAPPQLERAVNICLEKEPDNRWQSAGDLMRELQWIAAGDAAAAPVSRHRGRERLWMGAAGVLFLALIVLGIAYFRRPAPLASGPVAALSPRIDPTVSRLSIQPPEGTTYMSASTLSPDGRRLAFIDAGPGGRATVRVRSLDSSSTQGIAGTEGAGELFWSPDSRYLAFTSQGKLRKIDASGGPVQTLCDAPQDLGGSWNREGVIVFAPNWATGLQRVPAAGGDCVPVTTLDASRGETAHVWPWFLPDGRHLLYLAYAAQRKTRIYVTSLDSGDAKRADTKSLLEADSDAAYAPPGYLMFVRQGALMAQPFDAAKLALSGEPRLVAERVAYFPITGFGSFSVSETGALAYQESRSRQSQLACVDLAGNEMERIGAPGEYFGPGISPDGRRALVSRTDPQTRTPDLWLVDLVRRAPIRLTFTPATDQCPAWSPDGRQIVFSSDQTGLFDLFTRAVSGTGADQLLVRSGADKCSSDWSADGRYIVYSEDDPKTRADLWILPLTGDRKPFPFLRTEFNENQGQFSPDGKWLAYSSDESGRLEVYVQSFPAASGAKWRISTNGGWQPRWRRDGRELYYVDIEKNLMVVEAKSSKTFAAGIPRRLIDARVNPPDDYGINYAVARDGKSFLITQATGINAPLPLNIVLNWTSALK